MQRYDHTSETEYLAGKFVYAQRVITFSTDKDYSFIPDIFVSNYDSGNSYIKSQFLVRLFKKADEMEKRELTADDTGLLRVKCSGADKLSVNEAGELVDSFANEWLMLYEPRCVRTPGKCYLANVLQRVPNKVNLVFVYHTKE